MSYILTVVGAIVALVGVWVSLYFGRKSLRRKEIEVRYLAGLALVPNMETALSDFKMSYRDIAVSHISKLLSLPYSSGLSNKQLAELPILIIIVSAGLLVR